MSAQSNADAIRAGYEAFAKGDIDSVAKLLAPGIRWHVAGRGPLTGTYEGRDEVLRFFGGLTDLTGGTFRVEIHDLLASDDHVVALMRQHVSHGDAHHDSNVVHVWHLRDGAATEFWAIPEDQHGLEELWAKR